MTSVDDVTQRYTAGVAPAPVSDVKLKTLEKGRVAIVVSGLASQNGSLYNPKNERPKHSTGLLYDSLMVRWWDKYVKSEKNSLFYGVFQLSEPVARQKKSRWSLSPLRNALAGTGLQSPIEPFGDSADFDVSQTGIIFIAKDPKLNPATNTKSNAYLLPIINFSGPAYPSAPLKIPLNGFEGAATSPVFSPDGRVAAFLQMKENGYESDKNRIIVIPDVSQLETAEEVLQSEDGKGLWDRNPSMIKFSNDGKTLYLSAPDEGTDPLFSIEIAAMPSEMKQPPKKLTSSASVKEVHCFGASDKGVLLTQSSFVDDSLWSIYDPAISPNLKTLSSNTRSGQAFGLSHDQVSSFWFEARNKQRVHALVVQPSNFDPMKKYPLAFMVHGGPQQPWADAWSTRWNMAVFAEAGYFVVLPNPTGSPGYSQAFTDAIQNNWGGDPYEDLVACFEHLETRPDFKFVDTDNAVALGASYGGYMMNWINGHPLGRKFKALVNHDGTFSMQNSLSTDELYFPTHEMGGEFWSSPEVMANWDRWDPARYTGNWSTPTLVIHSDKDYRLPISEGLATFNVLQMRGIESQFLTFPDETHFVLDEENSLVWHTVVLNWINKHVGLPEYGKGPEPQRS